MSQLLRLLFPPCDPFLYYFATATFYSVCHGLYEDIRESLCDCSIDS